MHKDILKIVVTVLVLNKAINMASTGKFGTTAQKAATFLRS